MKLIDKDAVVTKIDRQIELLKPFLSACAGQIVAEANAKLSVLEGLKNFLDTLEVKEVDLEKELDSMITPELKFHKALPSLFDVAKHFFELGFMHTLSWKDIRLIAEIGEEFMCSEESDAYTNEESYYNAILNKLKEKGLDYKTQKQEIRDIKALEGEEV